MVFKDLEGTKQARKELAEKESKILQSLQGKAVKPQAQPPMPEPKPEPTPSSLLEMINVGYEDYKQFQSFFKDDSDCDSEVDILNDPMYQLPKPEEFPHHEMNNLKALLETHLEAGPEPQSYMNTNNSKSPAYMAIKKKMQKVHKRKLLKTLIKKHGTKPVDLSLVDNLLTDVQVDEMILTCLKLEQAKGELSVMPQPDLFGTFGY